MAECAYEQLVMCYHDGELTPAQGRTVREHLDECPACRQYLSRLRATSKLVGEADAPPMPRGMLERLHGRVEPVRAPVIVRICRPVALAAAAVLVVCLACLWQTGAGEAPHVGPPSTWEMAALTPATEAAETDSAEIIALWMVDGLSEGNGG